MSSVLDDQPYVVLSGKVGSCNNVFCTCHVNRVTDIVPQLTRVCYRSKRIAILVLKLSRVDLAGFEKIMLMSILKT